MFEDMTYETLLARALSRVTSVGDKREGSMVMNGVAPSMAELVWEFLRHYSRDPETGALLDDRKS